MVTCDSEVPLQVCTGAWAGLNLVFLNLGVGMGGSRMLGQVSLNPRGPLVWGAVWHSFLLPPLPLVIPWIMGEELQPLGRRVGVRGGIYIFERGRILTPLPCPLFI